MRKLKLSVLANGGAKVPNYAAHEANITSRFVGWEHDPDMGESFQDPTSKETKKSGGHRLKKEPTEMEFRVGDPHFAEYLMHLRDGDLLPADEETARLCGKKVSE